MARSLKDMMAAADSEVPRISTDEAARLAADGALVVDVRDPSELATTGPVEGAVNVSRGMLEFRADPASPYHDDRFRADRPVVLFCASGGRAALAGRTLKEMGYGTVYNAGGVKDWLAAGKQLDTVLKPAG
jgi:rhodanese-related sulfurtransferase